MTNPNQPWSQPCFLGCAVCQHAVVSTKEAKYQPTIGAKASPSCLAVSSCISLTQARRRSISILTGGRRKRQAHSSQSMWRAATTACCLQSGCSTPCWWTEQTVPLQAAFHCLPQHRCQASNVTCCHTWMMASARRSLSTGLDRKPSMPALRHSLRSLSLALAVMATMGTCTPTSLRACS